MHRAHRGQGYGRAVTIAAASALRELGSSRMVVYCESSNVGAVATRRSAGMEQVSERRDMSRDA
ncbi:GNAT family N-acetyltransferase [Nonomuraea sp. NPDC050310]|uniref:GNAT family N-acetyltransferase n=1 Tax=unclassified Nonomuraea TaxID=2593643 RepID=UPI0033C79F5A